MLTKKQEARNEVCKNDELSVTDDLAPPHIQPIEIISYKDYKTRKVSTEVPQDNLINPLTHSAKENKGIRPQKDPVTKPVTKPPSHGIINCFLNIFSKDLAIDLGTANTVVYMKQKGIVLNEPSVVALHKNGREKQEVLAVGMDAKKMLGKVPPNISAIRPLRDGVITNFEVAGLMLKHFIKKVREGLALSKPRIVIAIPSGLTSVEKRAVKEAAEQAGAREVFLIQEPMAAAVGAKLLVTEPRCNMVIDIGGGTTEVAVISLAGIVSGRSLRIAGDEMDSAIIHYIKKKYNFIIGMATAERLKITIGNACPDIDKPETMEIKGRDLVSGKPNILTITSEEVREAISDQINAIAEAVRGVLEKTPPELAADIIDRGIVLTGGVALLKNLDKYINEITRLPVRTDASPLLTVAIGSGKILDSKNILKLVAVK
ncbi:rod shape-determining protein [Desulfonema magnum]|nr:rod shape-determining protein [Desulfonema magnum]